MTTTETKTTKRHCRHCGHENTALIWDEDGSHVDAQHCQQQAALREIWAKAPIVKS